MLAAALKLPRESGLLVADVTPDGSAAAAGMEINDIILTLDGKQMENVRQFGVNIYRRAGETVSLDLLRAGKPLNLRVAVLERPRDPDRLLALARTDEALVAKLGVMVVELDGKIIPLLPPLRRMSGVVLAGVVTDLAVDIDSRLQPGDVVHELNGSVVTSVEGLKKALETMKKGQVVALQVDDRASCNTCSSRWTEGCTKQFSSTSTGSWWIASRFITSAGARS